MPLHKQVMRMEIVGHERTMAALRRRHQREKLLKILGLSPSRINDVHPQAKLLLGLGQGRAFVIRSDAGGNVAIQIPPREAGRVTVTDPVMHGGEFFQDRVVPGQTPG